MGRRCAYLTMDDISGFVSDAELSFAPMAQLGWDVEMVPWQSDADWNAYELVYICTPWDYQNDVAGFLDVLQSTEKKLLNGDVEGLNPIASRVLAAYHGQKGPK